MSAYHNQDNTTNLMNSNSDFSTIFEIPDGNLTLERLSPISFSSAPKPNNKKGPKRSLKKGMTLLPPDFQASDYSVLCGRGKGCYNATGNRRLRVIVSTFLQQYVEAQNSPHSKTRIIEKVVNMVKECCPVGAFVRYEDGRYFELSLKGSKEKVAALFRDCLQASHKEQEVKSKQVFKQQKKKQRQAKQMYDPYQPPAQQSLHQFQLQIFQQQQQQRPQQPPQQEQWPEQPFALFPDLPMKPLISTPLERQTTIDSQGSDTSRGSFYDVDTNRSVSISEDELACINIEALMG